MTPRSRLSSRPKSYVGICFSGTKDRMGCDIPKVIDLRSLPVQVQDHLMRAEIFRLRATGSPAMSVSSTTPS